MAVSAPGVGSSIDVNSIITQLMALERRPLDILNQRQSQYNTQLSAYGKVKSDLSAFQSAVSALKDSFDFSVFKATSSNTSVLSASADSSALAGVHSVTVSTLAKSHIQVAATGFADTGTTAVGNVGDTLSFTSGSNTFTVTLDSSNNTLEGLQNAINSASDNYGVTASILNDGSANGNRLVITANDSGTANAVTLGGTLNASLAFATTQPAADAVLTVDGVSGIVKSSNTISDILPGVTLALKSTGTIEVTVEADNEAITKLAQNLVSAYNTLVDDMTRLRSKGGELEADNTLLTIRNQLADVFNNGTTGGAYKYLSEVGISLQKDGKLALDSSAFSSALSSNFKDVVNLFSNGTDGTALRFYNTVTALLETDGIVDARTDGITESISLLDSRIDQVQYRLEKTEERLRAQYAALDSTLGVMRQTSNYLLAQLGS